MNARDRSDTQRVDVEAPPPLLVFSRAHRRLVAGLALAFALLVAAGIHGYSISMWHKHLDDSPPTEILFGEAQWLRMDDWMVQIPLALSQRAHDPAFPVWNTKLGLGQETFLPVHTPIAHVLTLFRPLEWGWFLGADAGLAWKWWLQAFGLFYATFLVLMIVSEGRFGLSVAGGAFLVFSPFVQFWSLNAAPFVVFAEIVYISACHVLLSPRRGLVLANAVLLAWAAVAFVVSLYPPYQIVLAQIFGLLLTATVLQRISRDGAPRDVTLRAAALAAASVVAGAAIGAIVHDAWGSIQRMGGTAYPAGRVSTGGGRAVWELFLHDLLVAPVVTHYGPLRNALQAASFWLLSPIVVAGLAVRASRPGARLDGTTVALALYVAFVAVFCCVGFPLLASQLLFLGAVPTERAVIGLGVAEVILLVRFLSTRTTADGGRFGAGLISLAWAGTIAVWSVSARAVLPDLSTAWVALACAANAAAAYGLLRARRPQLVLGALALVLVPCTAWFNPLVRGGTDWLLHNSVSTAIRELDEEAGGESAWLVFNSDNFANLLRALDVRTLGGVFPLPQLELFHRVDPGREFEGIYNRYANAVFMPKSTPGVAFRLLGPDVFFVDLPLDPTTLTQLGATHVAFVSERRETWDKIPGLTWLRSEGKFHFYRVTATTTPGAAASAGSPGAEAAADPGGSGSRDGGG
jgi:hypothetical protein